MVVFINSTSQIHSIMFTLDGCSVGKIEKDSRLWSRDCKIELMYKNRGSAFICSDLIKIVFSSDLIAFQM